MTYPVASCEAERLAALADLQIIGTPRDPDFDRVCKLAKDLFDVPVAIISFLEADEQWFKAVEGLEFSQASRWTAICNYTVLSDKVFAVENLAADPRFADNPFVIAGMRFYAGAPLAMTPGYRLGSLCLIDYKPRTFDAKDRALLEELAAIVVSLLQLHKLKNEAKAQRDALLVSEERLRLAIKTTELGSWEYSKKPFRLKVSLEGKKLLGFEPSAELSADALFERVHLEDVAKLRAQIADTLAGGLPEIELTIRILRASDFEERWIRLRGKKFVHGAAETLVGTYHDVTDLQVRARHQQGVNLLGHVAIQECDLQTLSQAACDVVNRTLGADYTCVALAEQGGSMLQRVATSGRLQDELTEPLFDSSIGSALVQRAFKEREAVIFADAASGGAELPRTAGLPPSIQSAMAIGIGDSGRRFGALVTGCARLRRFTSSEINFLEAINLILNTALERREAVNTLRLRDRALEAASQGIAICDATKASLPLIYVNPAVEKQMGYSSEGLINRGWSLFLNSEDVGPLREAVMRSLVTDGRYCGIVTCKHADGRSIQNEISVSAVRDDAGHPTHYVAVYTDVTHKLRLENEMRQAQKMEAVGQLTGGVAHDFNNLLTVILGNAEILAEMAGDPTQASLAEMIVEAAEKGANNIQRLLAFGRRQDLLPQNLDVNELIRSLASLLKTSAGEKVLLHVNLDEMPLLANLDRTQLDTAVLNLVVNARDAMPDGGKVTLSTRRVELSANEVSASLKPGAYVSLEVADTGKGIAPETLDRVFEPFFTTKEVGKGTGLGLSMVYGFAKQSGGIARISSKLGEGTIVQILLPESRQVVLNSAAAKPTAPIKGKERILVVEDQDDVRSFVTAQLVSLGYDVSVAPDSVAALKCLEQDGNVELLFTDIIMPGGLDGVQLAERATRLKPDLRVLFTSGYSDLAAERSSRHFDSGSHLLKKPYRRSELSDAVRQALS